MQDTLGEQEEPRIHLVNRVPAVGMTSLEKKGVKPPDAVT